MMRITVSINEREIAVAEAVNQSNLGKLSDYHIEAISEGSPITHAPEARHSFRLEGHEREQSAWALVAKIAREVAEREGARDT